MEFIDTVVVAIIEKFAFFFVHIFDPVITGFVTLKIITRMLVSQKIISNLHFFLSVYENRAVKMKFFEVKDFFHEF